MADIVKNSLSQRCIMIVSGEESGDARGAEVIRALKAENPDITFFGIGGDRMSSLGMELIYHMRDMAFLGFMEVVRHLPHILRVFRRLKQELLQRKPDLVLLVDYPGFNLRFAKKAKKLGFKTAYYVSPQVWAWGSGRVKKMAAFIDRMHVILPFEAAIYQQEGIDVRFVGHPLKGTCKPDSDRNTFFKRENLDQSRPVVGLLPGSRKQELSRLMPEMAKAGEIIQETLPEVQIITGAAPSLNNLMYQQYGNSAPLTKNTHDVMAYADAVLVASGTATLETAILGTPMVICYKMAQSSYAIGRLLVNVRNIGLANIVAGKTVAPELIQKEASAENMAGLIIRLLQDKGYYNTMKSELSEIGEKLGPADAAGQVAVSLLQMAGRAG